MIRYINIIFFSLVILTYSTSFALEGIPFPARLIIHKAQGLMDNKKYAQAIDLLKRFQEKGKSLKPGGFDKKGYRNYFIDFTLGNCFFMIKEYSEAKKYYLNSVKKKPDFSTGWINLAQCYYELKDYKDAADAFIKAYESSSKKDPEYLYYAGICFLSAGSPLKALTILNRLLSMNIKVRLEWKEAIAHAYIASNKLKEALPLVEEISDKIKGEKRNQWQEIRLHLYLSLNMDKKALLYLKRLIREDPLQPKWWKGLAHLYLKEDRYKDALSALIIKGFLDPLTKEEQRTAAELSMAIGIPKESLRFYKAISGEKPSPRMAYYIAQCYIRVHKLKDALRYVNKGIKIAPKDERLLLLKGQLLYQLGRYKEAGSLFERSARQKINPGMAWLMAGYSFWNAKEYKYAYYAFKRAIKYPSQRSSASKALQLCFSSLPPEKYTKDPKYKGNTH